MEDTTKKINQKLAEAGLDSAKVKKLLKGDLGNMFDKLLTGVQENVRTYIEDINTHCITMGGQKWNERANATAIFESATNNADCKQVMSERVYSLFVKAAKEHFFPGIKTGQYRTPKFEDVTTGKSGNTLQDIMIVMFEEASIRKGNNV